MTKLDRVKAAVFGVIGRICVHCGSRFDVQPNHINGRHWAIRRVNQRVRWKRYLEEALMGKLEAACGKCNRRLSSGIRYEVVDKMRQGPPRRRAA